MRGWNSESIPASESVCSKDWKYIKWLATGTEELFDLRRDAHEVGNLGKDPAHASDLARLRARYDALKKEIGGTPVEQLEHMPYGGGPKPDVGKRTRKGKGKNKEDE